MKSNNFTLNKILFILPVALLVVAMLIVAFVGFNKTIDFKKYYQFDVRFNTTIEKSDYASYKSEFLKIAESNNVKIYSQEAINDNINSGLEIKILANSKLSDDAMQERVDAFKDGVKNFTGVNDSANIVIQNEAVVLPHTWSHSFWMGLLTICVGAVVIFLYVWFRFEIKLALSYLASVLFSEVMLFSIIAITRIPVGLNFMTPYVVAFVMISALTIVIFSRVRTLNTDNKQNLALVTKAIADTKIVTLSLLVSTVCVAVVLVSAYTSNVLFNVLQILLAIACVIYCIAYVLIPIWTKTYNRANDKHLQNKLNKQSQQSNVKNKDDKLVV